MFGHVLPSRAPRIREGAGWERREVALDDGDRLVALARGGSSGVRVLLLHGLSGDANSDYVRRAAAVLGARGHGVWAVNHRGCGAGAGLAARPYHSGRSEDLAAVLAASRAEAPEVLHVVVGFSMSGNIALLHAAERRRPAPDGIVAVNPPVDIGRASADMGRGISRLYQLRFVWRLRREVRARERAGLTRAHYAIPLTSTMLAFDDAFTAPEAGFEDGRDYYATCSTIARLGEIDTPAVVLTAGDDPFVDARVYDGAERSERVLLHVEPHGGHVGYLARRGLGFERWLDGALVHYVEALANAAR